jgi:23S rRNA (adenine2503-C2)-methyltransferase
MARELHRRGVLTKLRRSAGQDVQAGCGQLRARHERSDPRRIEIVAAPAARPVCSARAPT